VGRNIRFTEGNKKKKQNKARGRVMEPVIAQKNNLANAATGLARAQEKSAMERPRDEGGN